MLRIFQQKAWEVRKEKGKTKEKERIRERTISLIDNFIKGLYDIICDIFIIFILWIQIKIFVICRVHFRIWEKKRSVKVILNIFNSISKRLNIFF
jgi:uncharacterized membrane protein